MLLLKPFNDAMFGRDGESLADIALTGSGASLEGVSDMLVTVAICTLNRAESLRKTLASLVAMRLPEQMEWEVVVVDNGSTDHTDKVITDFAERLPIRREYEPQRGHTPARNRAVGAAKGEYIVWTDDDVSGQSRLARGLRRCIPPLA